MDTRRNFVKKLVAGGSMFLAQDHLLLGETRNASADSMKADHGAAKIGSFTVDNPYAAVRWENVVQVPSTSHVHLKTQDELDIYYHQFGLRHIPISNYYPSAPTYPIKSIRENQYMVEQDFGVIYNPDGTKPSNAKWEAGHLTKGPLHWNDIIKPWAKELPPKQQAELPFQVGDFIFKNVPDDLIVSPNAEHHSFTNAQLHACGLGSMYCSGNFDAHDLFKTQEHGYGIGTSQPWQVVFKGILDNLLFPDGGGVTINHPMWSHLTFKQVTDMLDLDPRVLGIEVYNDFCEIANDTGWALPLWDQVLKTGRKCLGFFVPDHAQARGRVMLLVPSFTEHECLKAYRAGSFYGSIIGTDLQFNKISLQGNQLEVGLSDSAIIHFVTDKGVADSPRHSVKRQVFEIPVDAHGNPTVSYVRVEVRHFRSTEKLFSQPIRFLKG